MSAAFGGTPLAAFDRAMGCHVVVTPAIAKEIVDVIGRLRVKLPASVHAHLVEYAWALFMTAEWVEPSATLTLCRDPNDDIFLEAGLAGRATVLLTGDRDLTTLTRADLDPVGLGDLRILTPSQFLRGT